MRVFLSAWLLFTAISSGVVMAGGDPPSRLPPVTIHSSEEAFEDVIENIKMAIIDRGMLVSGTLHVSDMLNRTGPDLGYSQVFVKAESVEFCSALISHKMSQAAPENIVICPFTIAVYVTEAEPEKVNVAYRLPLLAGDAGAATDAIIEMLDGIVEDSI
ncbi:MAG: hypothetical protein KZQ93_11225 [Candidatus Thiodiazotropha sp. (ex Monitilora ramsayi)]|nr:hypothetical protein [Candidatus Thiodiazotropha sp. (ex Monitilora ramsayi)]